MSTGVDCQVYIDGERLPTGLPTDDPDVASALSGLQITWGRDTTVDQPPPTTCTFDVLDAPGIRALDLLSTGRRVDVIAAGVVYPDEPGGSSFLDPGFETTDAPSWATVNAAAALTTQRAHAGARSLRVDPVNPGQAWSVTLGPAPFQPAGSNPAAWDAIPTSRLGQTWGFGASVWLPAGARAEVRPVLFSGPWASTVQLVDQPLEVTGTGEWVQVSGRVVPAAPFQWVGVRITVWPTGLRWRELTGTWRELEGTWRDLGSVFVDDITVTAPEGGADVSVLAFSGRITELGAGWDDRAGASVVHVTCDDYTADLDNADIGDEPWGVEPMATRFGRVLDLSGLPITATIDPSLAGTLLSYQDVDRQSAAGLLKDFAQSVDGVLWSATHMVTGTYLRVEDPATRIALRNLAENEAGQVIIITGETPDAVVVSACDVLRDPVQWTQSVADVSTRVAVTWLQQGVDDQGRPETTERTVTVINPGLEAGYGVRRISVSTLLQSETDAFEVANRLAARTGLTGWRAAGLTIDDPESLQVADSAAVDLLLQLLDGTRRIGLPIRLTDLPDWTPIVGDVPVYLEGGTYTHQDGTWQLDLIVSRADALGRSVTWAELDPDWAWIDFHPDISWADLIGVGPSLATPLEEAT